MLLDIAESCMCTLYILPSLLCLYVRQHIYATSLQKSITISELIRTGLIRCLRPYIPVLTVLHNKVRLDQIRPLLQSPQFSIWQRNVIIIIHVAMFRQRHTNR